MDGVMSEVNEERMGREDDEVRELNGRGLIVRRWIVRGLRERVV
jgi:hypothetical protein